jgi:putative nucleotidyltransferase with HDIG domain
MIRIVFVDDELNLLQGMRRSLHAMRSDWNMDFALSGAEALTMLKTAPADVIVSDMRMPGMDGWQLLTEVKKLYPQTVRLILSGDAEASSIMRAVGMAHQYLAKPCDSTAIKNAINQTQKLRYLVNHDQLTALVGQISTLPSAPQAFQEILACLQQPNASMSDIARIISRDVAMTANIMKVVNSAFFGARQPIVSTDRAVAYLGLDTLGALVLGHSVFKSNHRAGIPGFNFERLWNHSLQTATAARSIALFEKFSSADAEKAFLAGILHDVGKIVFATRTLPTTGAPISAEEHLSLMSAHHAGVGAYLLGLWGFPNPIVEAVAFHHSPRLASTQGLSFAGLVHIADYLVHQGEMQTPNLGVAALESGFLESLGLNDRLPQWQSAIEKLESAEAA